MIKETEKKVEIIIRETEEGCIDANITGWADKIVVALLTVAARVIRDSAPQKADAGKLVEELEKLVRRIYWADALGGEKENRNGPEKI